MRTSVKKKAPKLAWTKNYARTMTMLGFHLWLIEQVSGDTMFAAECFLQDIKKRTKSVLLKQAIEHCWQALEVVAYGPGFDPDFDEFSAADQEFICMTAKQMSKVLTDAPKHTAAV
jgi:hypothetical protein